MQEATIGANSKTVISSNTMGLGQKENLDKNYIKESANIFAK
jgi:hypothetical protein